MRISIIAAMSSNRVIGLKDDLPWHLPPDLKHFKQLTMGHHMIMGRKTFDTIGRPLPGRVTIVVTRRTDFVHPGVLVAHSIDDALRLAEDDKEVFIAGGGEIYRLTLDLADRIYLTVIHHEFEGDTFFPPFDESKWEVVEEQEFHPDEQNPLRFTFLTLDRR